MKAIVYRRYGSPDVLQLQEVPKPRPRDNEVLIRVRAVEATKSDCELRSLKFPVGWLGLPMRLVMGIRKPRRPILGIYFSGEIEALGRNVAKFSEGQQVFGASGLRMGAYAEYLCLPESSTLVPKPQNMTFEEAAAVPLGGLNALHFMRIAHVQNGERVLINGAGGSIGTFAIQIARNAGAEVTVVDSAPKEAMLRSIGADHFVDYTQEDFTTSGRSYDVILDMVARKNYAGCVRSLTPKGRYLIANPRISDMLRSVVTTRTSHKKVSCALARETEEELLAIKAMIDEGRLKAVVERIFPMEQAADAHRRVETEQRLGLVVISLSSLAASQGLNGPETQEKST